MLRYACAVLLLAGCATPSLRRWSRAEATGVVTVPLYGPQPAQEQINQARDIARRQCGGDFEFTEEGLLGATGSVQPSTRAYNQKRDYIDGVGAALGDLAKTTSNSSTWTYYWVFHCSGKL